VEAAMNMIRSLVQGLIALFNKEQRNQEIDEELRNYRDSAVAEKMRRGLSREDAIRSTQVEIGNSGIVTHKVWSAGWESTADSVWQDIRFGTRQLLKSPGFTFVAILSLALGIGANTAIFTLINNLMLKSLPVHDPKQLVSFGKGFGGGEMDGIGPGPLDLFPYDFYKRVEQEHPEFQGICAFGSFSTEVSVRFGSSNSGPATQAVSHLVSGNFFSVLGAEPMMGRAILPSDADAPGRNPVAVISHRYWQQALSSDPAIIGRAITVNGTSFTVVGVMPAAFYGVDLNEESADMWVPITMQREIMLQPTLLNPGGLFWLHMMGRRKPGATVEQAQAWVTAQLQQFMLDREGSQVSAFRKEEIRKIYVPLLPGEGGISNLRELYAQPLKILMGVVVLVLLIACANLANFLIAKAASREREISTRLALGSSRSRIVRQILTETLLLSFTGGIFGLILAYAGSRLLINFVISGSPHTALSPTPDLHVLAFTFTISILTGLLFGLVPALRVSRIGMAGALNATTRTAASAGGGSSRLLPKLLVTAQVMLSLILLAGAGLFVRTLRNLQNQDVGFNRSNVLMVSINPKFAGYKPEQLNSLYNRMLERLDALPGIRSATISGGPPMSGSSWSAGVAIEGYAAKPNEDRSTQLNRVGPRYFETLGIPLLQGRTIGEDDTATSLRAVVVNKTMAEHFFPHGDAVGQRLKVEEPGTGDGLWQIVGVVRDTKLNSVREKPQRMTYVALEQLTGDDSYAYWLQIQTAGDPAKVAGEVRAALAEIDPNLSILEVKTISEQLDHLIDRERLISQLSTFFSLLALSLACIGLYGVMTYNVVRRTNEIGIRIALGAQKNGVLWMVLKESLLLLGIGVVLGVPAALAASHAVQSQLFGLAPSDPSTLVLAVLVISGVTLAAAYFPARRAAGIDPMVALRYE
jgi:predicted permease